MRTPKVIIWMVVLLALASLACSQAGEILTPEEATIRAQAPSQPSEPTQGDTQTGPVTGAEFAVGDSVTLVSGGAVVPLRDKISAQSALNFAPNNQPATVIGVGQDDDGVVWYQIDGGSGQGWVSSELVQGAAGEEGTGDTSGSAGFQAGDTAFLTGKGFLINLMRDAGSKFIQANQEQGVSVTVKEVQVVDGVNWYLIDAPTGEGWVPEENLTSEAP